MMFTDGVLAGYFEELEKISGLGAKALMGGAAMAAGAGMLYGGQRMKKKYDLGARILDQQERMREQQAQGY